MRQGLSPSDVFQSADLTISGVCRWRDPIPSRNPGVYVVSLDPNAEEGGGMTSAPLDPEALDSWLRHCPGLSIDGRRADAVELAAHLARWWLPGTSILYIGKAEGQSLRRRVGQYFDTPLGAPRPHGGGYWLKTLAVLPEVYVHYAEVPIDVHAGVVEDDLINAFLRLYVSMPADHPEPELPLPWANLQVDRPPPRRRRDHGLPSLQKQQRITTDVI